MTARGALWHSYTVLATMALLATLVVASTTDASASTDTAPADDQPCPAPAGHYTELRENLTRIEAMQMFPDQSAQPRWLAPDPGVDELNPLLEEAHMLAEGRRDVVGSYIDFIDEQMVYVADRGARSSVEAALASSAAFAPQGTASKPLVAVVESCRPKAEIEQQYRQIRNRLQDRVVEGAFTIGIDPARSAIVVGNLESTDLSPDEVRELLDDPHVHLSPLVDESGARRQDVPTHWGDAGIRPRNAPWSPYNGNRCSVAFPLQTAGGGWSMASAEHCRRERPAGDTTLWWDSGPGYYGVEHEVNPAADAMLIGSSTRNYARRFWVDPDCPDSRCFRRISSKRDTMDMGRGVCVGGMRTRLQCGASVVGWRQLCGGNQCYWTAVAFRARALGPALSCDGDSGGAVFGRTGTLDASARGMHQRGNCNDTSEFLEIASLEDALNGTVVTSGNARPSDPL
ncbi:hypothetical protein FTX61_18825 [Nitriliruptoraceae bacterium ZYF776]|nr:hypothetical protein [Profundirhabdus halotolerans]